MAKNNQLRDKKRNIKRSVLTGRVVNGRDVILADEVLDYVKKLGYRVIPMRLEDHIKTLTIVFLCFASLILMTSLGSAKPFETNIYNFEQGLAIIENPQNILYQNENHEFNFFVYNQTTGALIDNVSVNCLFYMADNNGKVILNSSLNYQSEYWNIEVLGSNLSRLGSYAYGVRCQNDNIGGALASSFEVKPTGIFAVNPQFMPYVITIAILTIFILIYFSLYPFASITAIILGFILLINQANILISFIIIGFGVYLAFKEDVR